MTASQLWAWLALAPALLMLVAALAVRLPAEGAAVRWQRLQGWSLLALLLVGGNLGQVLAGGTREHLPGLLLTPFGAWMALLVQGLGHVIGRFSARYLNGEPGQGRYAAQLPLVLAAVHLLLLADHWLPLILAWAAVAQALAPLLTFYAERPFAQLAAHKKRIADRVADALLLVAAGSAHMAVDSASLSDLMAHVVVQGADGWLTLSALALVLAVIVRTACLPVHGWLIQVMEAPTPVSALLHAGVVNLGGFVLLRFAPLIEAVPAARWLLATVALATAVLAGFVMLTRVSIKVRLAWSTVAQMGFMLLECALGLYTLAALHLIGHSLYKAQAFLGSGETVRATRRRWLAGSPDASLASLALAPFLCGAVVTAVASLAGGQLWPWWWTLLLALAWAPLCWWPAATPGAPAALPAWQGLAMGLAQVALLSLAAVLVHYLPLGLASAPVETAGLLAVAAFAFMYAGLAMLHWRHGGWSAWRRWSYAGFYVDELYTRLALRLWPTDWARRAP